MLALFFAACVVCFFGHWLPLCDMRQPDREIVATVSVACCYAGQSSVCVFAFSIRGHVVCAL